MQQTHEGPHFVGSLNALATRLESAALFAHSSGVQLATVDGGVVVAAGRPRHTIAHTMPALRASGVLWISDFAELVDAVRATIGERPAHRTQDRRTYTLIATDDRFAELSIDGCEPISLRATREPVITDPTAVPPTCATVHHADLMHAIPQHLAALRMPGSLPDGRLQLEVSTGEVVVAARDRHATTVTTVAATKTLVNGGEITIAPAPWIIGALRHADPERPVDIGYEEHCPVDDRITFRCGGLTIRTTSVPGASLARSIAHAASPIPWSTARFRGADLRTIIATMVQDYAEAWLVSDVTLAVTLSPNSGLSLVAVRDGQPDLEHRQTLTADVNGSPTTVHVAASRLRHGLDQLEGRITTLQAPGNGKPLVLTEHNDPRRFVISQVC